MNLKPMNDSLIVVRDQPDEETEAGIFVPDGAAEIKKTGTVLAVGPGRVLRTGKRAPMDFEVGDKVMLGNSVSVINWQGKEVLVVKEKNIVAKLM